MVDRLFDAAKARPGAPTGRLRKALDFIERNLNRGITLNEVADHVNLSSCHFSRLFKQKVGLGFSDYLTRR
ncbi:helix-turn-helix transcriptional regulator, partial [Mycobacterium tuberculosis]|uniref:helix-turn-helix transcriptional regulator n=1 Tax=Mycobacterium tuberculosis TaxID=1773 RepID=UPI001F32F8F8